MSSLVARSVPSLYYFDAPGRAEASRLAFRIGHVEFTDVRFSHEEWMKSYKQMSPSGQCPFLVLPEAEGGMMMTESRAILLYASAKSGLVPSHSARDMASGIQVLDQLEAVGSLYAEKQYYKPTPERVQEIDRQLPGQLALLEKLIKKTQTIQGYTLPCGLSFADVAVTSFAIQCRAQDSNFTDYFPCINKVADLTLNHPNLRN